MQLLSVSKEEMIFISDISRTVIPLLAAMGGAMTGSYLTYRFQKKDKIRDLLFSYKVKSYSSIAEYNSKLLRDLEDLEVKLLFNVAHTTTKGLEIYTDFRKMRDEQFLFLSIPIDNHLSKIQSQLWELSNIENNRNIAFEIPNDFYKKEDIGNTCLGASKLCKQLFIELQKDLNLTQIH